MSSVIGIDPGHTGAIVVLDEVGAMTDFIDMPMIGGELDAHRTAEYLAKHEPRLVCIEKVHAMPKQGVASTWKFGMNYGGLIAILDAEGHRFERVRPQEWKASFALNGKPKDAARRLALDLWPERREDLRLVKHGGRADAALIAEHGRRAL